MAPLVDVGRLQEKQLDDIKAVLRLNRIPFVVYPNHPHLRTFLCVREKDYESAHRLLREEIQAYARRERDAWQKEWEEKFGGSYLRWLAHRFRGDMKLALNAIFRAL